MLTFLCKPAQIPCRNERNPMWFARFLAVALGMTLPNPAPACDLALALAVDVSGSVDVREFDIQMTGLADALRDSSIAEAQTSEGWASSSRTPMLSSSPSARTESPTRTSSEARRKAGRWSGRAAR